MPDYKPDLTYKITIRCSQSTKQRAAALCKKEDLGEAETLRYCLEAGLVMAEREGMAAVMALRRSLPPAGSTKTAKRRRAG